MQIKILKTVKGATSPAGIHTMEYKAGETYDIYESLANIFISNGFAIKIKEEVKELIFEEVENIEIEEKKFEEEFENKAITKAPENKSFKKTKK